MAPVAAGIVDTDEMNRLYHLDTSDVEDDVLSCPTDQMTIKASNVRRVTVVRRNKKNEVLTPAIQNVLLLFPSRHLLLIPLTVYTPPSPSVVTHQ
jgi:hypothetical protein